MIWSDGDIADNHKTGLINIEPFNHEAIQPASYDLTLGDVFWCYRSPFYRTLDPRQPVKPEMDRFQQDTVIIESHQFLLGMTREKISLADNVVARVEGKSSLGRLGLTVHSTAGFIDPGNQNLRVTLELFNQSPRPIRLYAGMWICQLAFESTTKPCLRPYGPERGSRYFGDGEAEPSRVCEKVGELRCGECDGTRLVLGSFGESQVACPACTV